MQPELSEALLAGMTETAGPDLSGPPSMANAPHPPDIEGYTEWGALAGGGQGFVFSARQLSTDRVVAVKVLDRGREVELQRFEQEARLLAKLQHPNIVPVYDFGRSADGRLYYVMRKLAGRSLSAWQRDAQPGEQALVQQMITIARAVAYAHEHGIVHRDLKPSNILIDEHNQPQLVDFGLAKQEDSEAELSLTGQVMGTLAYMAPEQARGAVRDVDARTDVYALGVILYEALAGTRPIDTSEGWPHALQRIEHDDPAPPQVASDLRTITLKTLQKEPDRRYQTAGALADDLERYLRGEPIEARSDSVVYKLQKRAKKTVARNRSLALVLVVPLVFAVCQWVVQPLATWSGLDRWYFATLQTTYASMLDVTFETVEFICLNKDTDFAKMANLLNLPTLNATNALSHRAVYGEIARKLGEANARCVVYTMYFKSTDNVHDVYFVEGLAAAAPTTPALAIAPLWYGDFESSKNLEGYLTLGATTGTNPDGPIWTSDLAVQRNDDLPKPGLVFNAIGVYLTHAKQTRLDPHLPGSPLTIRMFDDTESQVGMRQLAYSKQGTPDARAFGYTPSDEVYQLDATRPTAAAFRASSTRADEFLDLTKDQLIERFEGKAVFVVADAPWAETAPAKGGLVPTGVTVGHAFETALNQLLPRGNPRRILPVVLLALAATGTLLGTQGRSRLVGGLAVGFVAVVLVTSFAAFYTNDLWSPITCYAAVAVAATSAHAVGLFVRAEAGEQM